MPPKCRDFLSVDMYMSVATLGDIPGSVSHGILDETG